MSSQLATLKGKIYEARNYLNATDYIVIKLSEALANGDDLTELKTTYAEQLAKRKEYRASIDTLQVEINALNEELKASEEIKNNESIEDVIEQPVEETITEDPIEETPTNTGEVIEEIPAEKVVEQPTNTPTEEVVEVDTTDQTSASTTNTSESVEEQPIDTAEEPITEETPITEEVIINKR